RIPSFPTARPGEPKRWIPLPANEAARGAATRLAHRAPRARRRGRIRDGAAPRGEDAGGWPRDRGAPTRPAVPEPRACRAGAPRTVPRCGPPRHPARQRGMPGGTRAARGTGGRSGTGREMPGAIDDFVAALGRRLGGPRRLKRDLLAEARDGLIDAAEALEAAGLGRAEAERRAVAEFGEVAEVAPGYQAELTARQGRHTAALVFLSVPATTLMWSELWRGYPWDPASLTATPAWFLPLARLIDWLQILTGGRRWAGAARVRPPRPAGRTVRSVR